MTVLTNEKRLRSRSTHWLKGLRAQARIIHALMLRSVLAQFGHENMGFFWLVGEPLILTCGIMLLWSIMKIGHSGEVGVIPFALTGYTFITLWRHIVLRSQNIIRSSISLRYHRQINNVDTLIALTIVEAIGTFSAFMVAIVPLWLLGYCDGIQEPLALVGGFFFTAWFSFSFALMLAALSEISEVVHHVVPAIMYLTLPLTGTFFMVDWLPEKSQAVVLWSPLVNCIEMIRAGLFSNEAPTHWSVMYLLCCCLVMTGLGLPLYLYMARRVDAS